MNVVNENGLKTLAAGIAHEVRNPLTGAKSRLFTLGQKNKGNVELEEQVEAIEQDLSRIEKVVHELQLYARPAKLELSAVPLKELCEDLSEQLKPHFCEAKVCLRLNVPQSYIALVDYMQIKDVLTAILMNALEASVAGGQVELNLTSSRFKGSRSQTSCVAVIIKNDGAGITRDQQKRIFQPFFTTKPSHTGLGLSICLAIIKSHKGELHVESPLNEGASFKVKLPVS